MKHHGLGSDGTLPIAKALIVCSHTLINLNTVCKQACFLGLRCVFQCFENEPASNASWCRGLEQSCVQDFWHF